MIIIYYVIIIKNIRIIFIFIINKFIYIIEFIVIIFIKLIN